MDTAFAAELSALKIPYAFVDNKIDELDYMLYYGVDPVKSGSLGAFLLTDRTHPSEIALVRLHLDPERIVVGFDDLKDNLACLEQGIIHCLVTRHIPQQALNALKSFADCISGRKSPSQRNRYVHMDILTRMNIDNY